MIAVMEMGVEISIDKAPVISAWVIVVIMKPMEPSIVISIEVI